MIPGVRIPRIIEPSFGIPIDPTVSSSYFQSGICGNLTTMGCGNPRTASRTPPDSARTNTHRFPMQSLWVITCR